MLNPKNPRMGKNNIAGTKVAGKKSAAGGSNDKEKKNTPKKRPNKQGFKKTLASTDEKRRMMTLARPSLTTNYVCSPVRTRCGVLSNPC